MLCKTSRRRFKGACIRWRENCLNSAACTTSNVFIAFYDRNMLQQDSHVVLQRVTTADTSACVCTYTWAIALWSDVNKSDVDSLKNRIMCNEWLMTSVVGECFNKSFHFNANKCAKHVINTIFGALRRKYVFSEQYHKLNLKNCIWRPTYYPNIWIGVSLFLFILHWIACLYDEVPPLSGYCHSIQCLCIYLYDIKQLLTSSGREN